MSEHLPMLEECEAAVMNQIIGPLVRQNILSTGPRPMFKTVRRDRCPVLRDVFGSA